MSKSIIAHASAGYWSAAILATALTCFATPAKATLIAADSILGGIPGNPLLGEYDNTVFKNHFRRGETSGGGQNPTIAGFTGPWSGNVTSGSLGVAQWTAEAPPFDLGISYQEGGRAKFAGVDNLQRRVQRELAPYTASDTYYMSFIAQVLTNETDLDGFVGIGFTNTGATITQTDANIVSGNGLGGLLIGAAGDGVSGTDYVVRHVGSTGAVQNDVILDDIVQNDPVLGTPYVRYTVVKLDFNDDPGNVNGNSKITIWQDPTVFSSEADATAAEAPLEFRTFALDTNADLTHLTFTGVDYSRAASFDEPRLGTTWEDVIHVPALDGDLDGDGFVGITDLNIVLAAWNQNVPPAPEAADPSGDGFIGIEDLNVVLGNWNAGTPPNASSVPEPTSLVFLAGGSLLWLRRNR